MSIIQGTIDQELTEAGTQAYCSFDPSTPEAKAQLYNGMVNPDYRISDEINQTISVVNVYAEMLELVDEDTGEISTAPRIVLFDSEGKSHVAVSKGIMNALKRLFKVFGQPSEWEAPIVVKVKQVGVKAGSMLTLELAKKK